jgi:hypothetical protein
MSGVLFSPGTTINYAYNFSPPDRSVIKETYIHTNKTYIHTYEGVLISPQPDLLPDVVRRNL